jgi:lambda repressor-like predicted transcriptional regulator
MPAQWTAEILGEMHLAGITAKQLAEEAGWHEKYLSAVMNGHRDPKGAEDTLRAALGRIKSKSQ